MEEFEQAYRKTLVAGSGETETDAAASVLAGLGDRWDAVAADTVARVIRECAARGWAGDDLVRMAGRELTPRHSRLAAGLADGTGIAAFTRAERLDRFTAATVLVEVLSLYGTLPRIPTAIPRGAPEPVGERGKVLGRIRALLAKAESTDFPDEAEALSAKAQQLMARHRVDEALLRGEGTGDGPGLRRIGVDRPYEGAKALLLDAVAVANRCEAVWSGDLGFSTVVGHESDLEAVDLLFTSLLVQADRALTGGGPSRRRDYRESFLIAYAARIRERLTAAADDEVAARRDAPGLLPVLAAQDLAVRTATRRLFPTTTKARLRGRDAEGWRQGEAAADGARL